MENVISFPTAEERGPWGGGWLDCRACGHTQWSTALMATWERGEPFECERCSALAADRPWAVCDVACPCGQYVRVVLWEPVDIMPARWPCACGGTVVLPKADA